MAKSEIIATILLYIIISNIIYSSLNLNYDLENNIAYEIDQFINGKLIYSFVPKDKCDANEEALKLEKWKGLKAGCKCPITGLYKGKCTKNQRQSFCKDVPEVPSKYYEKFDFKNICIKRTKERYRDFLLKIKL